MNELEIGKHIVDTSVNVHTTLGPPLSVFASLRDPNQSHAKTPRREVNNPWLLCL